MFKKLGLGTKMFCGFALILLMSCAVAAVGFFGITTVNRHVHHREMINKLVKGISGIRQAEQRYMIYGNREDAARVLEGLKKLAATAERFKASFSQPEDREQMERISKEMLIYEQAFSKYLSLAMRRRQTMTDMKAKAKVALLKTEIIRAQQNDAMKEAIAKSQESVKLQLKRSERASQLMKIILEAEAARKVLSVQFDEDLIGEWTEDMDSFDVQISLLGGSLNKEEKVRYLKKLKELSSQYRAQFKKYLTTQDSQELQKAIRLAEALKDEVNNLGISFRAALGIIQMEMGQRVSEKIANADDAAKLSRWLLEARMNEKEFIISHGAKKWGVKVQDLVQQILKLTGKMKKRLDDERQRRGLAKVADGVRRYYQAFLAYGKLMAQQKLAEEDMRQAARRAQKLCSASMARQKANTEKVSRMAELVLPLASGVVILVGLLLAWFITRSITKPLKQVIDGLGQGAEQVAAAAGEVNNSSQALAQGASQQAASLEETSASLEEMASMTNQNAENAGQADGMMKEVGRIVEQANASMKELKTAMDKINAASDETAKIIKTIDEIAFQTNLLALNAAVEAARAGEAGAGFAVVADEVRNLAMRAAEAAKNTAALIEGNIKEIKAGSELVVTTDEAFDQVEESAKKVGELVGEIAAASVEQAQGVEQLNQAMVDMDKVTQQNAASAEQAAAAAEELSAQSEVMNQFVHDLMSLVEGAKAATDYQVEEHREQEPEPAQLPYQPREEQDYEEQETEMEPKRTKPQPRAAGGKRAKPEEVIPLDDDFTDF